MVGQLGTSNLKTKNAEEKQKTQNSKDSQGKKKKKSFKFLNLLCRTHITHAEMERVLFISTSRCVFNETGRLKTTKTQLKRTAWIFFFVSLFPNPNFLKTLKLIV
jgi:hypothetical protein